MNNVETKTKPNQNGLEDRNPPHPTEVPTDDTVSIVQKEDRRIGRTVPFIFFCHGKVC